MIGVELLDSGALALDVDEAGRVVGRHAAKAPGAPARAAVDAVAKLPSVGPQGVAVAALDPDSAETVAAVQALAARFPGTPPRQALASGTAAAAAEAWAGAARGASDVVFLAVADHAIGGVVRNGAPMTGARRRGAAVGWLALNPVEREDYRKIGCLEAEVAAMGVVRRLIWRIKAGDHSHVLDAANGDLNAITLDHILNGARKGDGVAASVMRDTARYLGMAAANLVIVADPQVLVLGGVMASAADLLFELVRTDVTRRLPPPVAESLSIVPAALGADAPAIGAVRLSSAGAP